MKHCLLIGFFILLLTGSGSAQNPIWKHFGLNEGLNDLSIVAISQDKDGIIWLGCQTGLVRFDGVRFEKIDAVQTENPYITSIIADKEGILWIGSKQGVWKYIPQKGIFKKIHTLHASSQHIDLQWNKDSSEILISSHVPMRMVPGQKPRVINPNVKGDFYKILAVGNQFLAEKLNQIVLFSEREKEKILVEGKKQPSVLWYPSQQCWLVATDEGIFKMSEKCTSISRLSLPLPGGNLYRQSSLYTDHSNRILVNTTDTLHVFSGIYDQHPKKYFWIQENPNTLIKPTRYLIDHDLNIWSVSPGNGLSVLHHKMQPVGYTDFRELNSRYLWATYHDIQRNWMLYGAEQGLLIKDLNIPRSKGKLVPGPQTKTPFTIVKIQDFDQHHWVVSSYNLGSWLLNKTSLQYKPLITDCYSIGVYKTPANEILVATTGVLRLGEYKNDYWNKELTSFTYAFLPLEKGVYVANVFGLFLVDYTGKIRERVICTDKKRKNIINSAFLCLDSRDEKKIFIGTISNGLCLYDSEKDELSKIKLVKNIASVYGMSFLNDTELLITTNEGICLYNLVSGNSQFYGMKNTLPFNDFNQFGYFANRQLISMCGIQGEISGSPAAIRQLFTDRAQMILQRKHEIISRLTVPAGQQSFALNVSIGTQSIAHQPVFKYRLKGLETQWHEADKQGSISYNYVPPGEYVLEIRMEDPNNILSRQIKNFPVEVVPLWWQTLWFQGTIYLLSLLLLIFLIRYFSRLRLNWKIRRMEAEQKVNNERLRISRELHDNVGSQLSYLITGLEASEMMSQKGNTENLTKNLENLQESARESMQQLRDAIWALNKEEISVTILVDRFSQWAYKMTEQYNVGLHIHKKLDREAELDSLKTLNIFRILQEAVHNVLKHAQSKSMDIHFSLEDHLFSAVIKDNGTGFENTVSAGNGLKNMQTRANELGATLEITSEKDKGTTISLRIFLNNPGAE